MRLGRGAKKSFVGIGPVTRRRQLDIPGIRLSRRDAPRVCVPMHLLAHDEDIAERHDEPVRPRNVRCQCESEVLSREILVIPLVGFLPWGHRKMASETSSRSTPAPVVQMDVKHVQDVVVLLATLVDSPARPPATPLNPTAA